MRLAVSALLIASLLTGSSYAQSPVTPLAPGKPAGVQQANAAGTVAYGVIGGVAVLGLMLALQSRGIPAIAPETAPPDAANLAQSEAAASTSQ